MKKYSFPKTMKISTLKEREIFYEKKFDINIIKKWLVPYYKFHVLAVDVGTNSGIYLKKHKNKLDKLIYISKYDSYEHLKKKIISYLPEDVYYYRNVFDNYGNYKKCKDKHKLPKCNGFFGQELIFDIDPENIKCTCKRKKIYDFCEICLEKTKNEIISLYHTLRKEYGLKKLKLVYSGRGYHIHVFDKKAFGYDLKQRIRITNEIKKRFPIDPWVSRGHIDLVRLPGSLNGLVSKIAIQLTLKEIRDFNPITSRKVNL